MWVVFLATLPTAEDTEARSVAQVLQRVADRVALKYRMGVAAAYYSGTASTAVAAGFTDAGLGLGTPTRLGQPDDMYVMGS